VGLHIHFSYRFVLFFNLFKFLFSLFNLYLYLLFIILLFKFLVKTVFILSYKSAILFDLLHMFTAFFHLQGQSLFKFFFLLLLLSFSPPFFLKDLDFPFLNFLSHLLLVYSHDFLPPFLPRFLVLIDFLDQIPRILLLLSLDMSK